jgi:hypothetical protein
MKQLQHHVLSLAFELNAKSFGLYLLKKVKTFPLLFS